MITGFFFDLDGTLVDTHQANFQAYRAALADIGVNLNFEDFKRSIGHQAQTFLPWFAPGLGGGDYKAIAARKAEYYKDLAHLSVLNHGLVAFMDSVTGSQLVLVTSAKRQNASAILGHHGLMDRFDHLIFAEDVQNPKPHPEGYELALHKTGLGPTQVMVFEDSDTGRQAAEAAGLPVVLIREFAI